MRVQSAEADAKKAVEAQRFREGELAVAEQRVVNLQQEAARAVVVPSTFPQAHRTQAETAQPTVQQDPPPEWALEIQRLRTEVARFKASRPVRDSVEAAQNVRAKAAKRRAGFMDDMPTDEQILRSWLEDKNL